MRQFAPLIFFVNSLQYIDYTPSGFLKSAVAFALSPERRRMGGKKL
jgi:hypothetical protein